MERERRNNEIRGCFENSVYALLAQRGKVGVSAEEEAKTLIHELWPKVENPYLLFERIDDFTIVLNIGGLEQEVYKQGASPFLHTVTIYHDGSVEAQGEWRGKPSTWKYTPTSWKYLAIGCLLLAALGYGVYASRNGRSEDLKATSKAVLKSVAVVAAVDVVNKTSIGADQWNGRNGNHRN